MPSLLYLDWCGCDGVLKWIFVLLIFTFFHFFINFTFSFVSLFNFKTSPMAESGLKRKPWTKYQPKSETFQSGTLTDPRPVKQKPKTVTATWNRWPCSETLSEETQIKSCYVKFWTASENQWPAITAPNAKKQWNLRETSIHGLGSSKSTEWFC